MRIASRLEATGNRKPVGAFAFCVCALLFALCVSAGAQHQSKPARIAYFSAGTDSSQTSRLDAFKDGLRALGYKNGSDIFIEQR